MTDRAAFRPITTQEQLDAVLRARLRRHCRQHRDQLAKFRAQYQQLLDNLDELVDEAENRGRDALRLDCCQTASRQEGP